LGIQLRYSVIMRPTRIGHIALYVCQSVRQSALGVVSRFVADDKFFLGGGGSVLYKNYSVMVENTVIVTKMNSLEIIIITYLLASY